MTLLAYTFQWDVVHAALGELRHGLRVTLELSAISLVLALALGLVVALLRMSRVRVLSGVAWAYIAVFRALSL